MANNQNNALDMAGQIVTSVLISKAAISGTTAIIDLFIKESVKGINSAKAWQKTIEDLQVKTGSGIGKVQALEIAFQSLGSKGDVIKQGFINMSGQLDELVPKFQKMGIETKGANDTLLSSDEIFMNLIKKLSTMPDSFDKAALEMQIFGTHGAALNEGINTIGTSFTETYAKAQDFGLMLSNEQSTAINDYNATLNDLNHSFEGFHTQVGVAVIPVLDDLMKALGLNHISLKGFGQAIGWVSSSAIAGFGGAMIMMGEWVQGLGKEFEALGKIAMGVFEIITSRGSKGMDTLNAGLKLGGEGLKQIWGGAGKGTTFMADEMTKLDKLLFDGTYKEPPDPIINLKKKTGGAGSNSSQNINTNINIPSQNRTEIFSGKCCCCEGGKSGKGSIEKAVAEASVAANRRLGAGADRAEISNRKPGEGADRAAGRAAALDPWAKFLDGLWKSMQSASGKFVDDIKGGLEKTISDVFSGAKDPIQAFTDLLNSSLSDSLKGVMDFLGKSLSDVLKPVIDSVSNWFGDTFKNLGIGQGMLDGIGAVASALSQPIKTSASQTGYGNPNPPGGTAVQSVQQVRGIVAAPETPMANINVSLSEAMKPTNMLISQSNSLLASILFEIQGLKNFTTHSYPR